MPSTVVHVALAGLVGTALLAEYFDGKAILVVMAATAFVDLDVFVGFWIAGAHRAAFHTLLLPGLIGAVLWWDVRGRAHPSVQSRVGSNARTRPWVRARSRLHSRWGARGVRVAWVTVVAVTFAGIGLDAFFNGANLLYPVHDRFYTLSGKVLYSTQDGFVQTLVNFNFDALFDAFQPEEAAKSGAESSKVVQPDGKKVRTTGNTHYRTGVDPSKGAEKGSVERLFPIAMTGERALLALTGYCVVGLRVWEERRRE